MVYLVDSRNNDALLLLRWIHFRKWIRFSALDLILTIFKAVSYNSAKIRCKKLAYFARYRCLKSVSILILIRYLAIESSVIAAYNDKSDCKAEKQSEIWIETFIWIQYLADLPLASITALYLRYTSTVVGRMLHSSNSLSYHSRLQNKTRRGDCQV